MYWRCTGFIFGWLMWSVHLTHRIYFCLFYLIFFLLAHWTVCYWLTSLCHIPGSHIPGRVFFSAAPQLLHWSVISKNGNFNLCLFINFFFFCSDIEQFVIDWPVCATSLAATFLAATFLAEFSFVQLHSCYIGQWFLRKLILINYFLLSHLSLLLTDESVPHSWQSFLLYSSTVATLGCDF